MSSSTTAALLAWCAEHRIQIDSTLQIIDSEQGDNPRHGTKSTASDWTSRERGLSVYSRDELIECSRTLVCIPKTAVLSVKSCFFSQHISAVPCGHGAHLSLALALYGELLLGPRSQWFSYLQSLPRETVDIAVFWGVDDAFETRTCTCSSRGCLNTDDTSSAAHMCQHQLTLSKCPWCVGLHDNRNAQEWLQVTEIEREHPGLTEEIRQYYRNVVEPTFHAVPTDPGLDPLFSSRRDKPGDSGTDTNPRVFRVTFPGFCHAYSLVSTRAFWVDAYHGLAMVPIADAFNHTNDNHVQMESDYDVCVECGSLDECEHDREMASTTVPASLLSNVHPLSHGDTPTSSKTDYLEMRTVRPISPFTEVFNTYGSLPNASLLSRYGFMLPENEHDTVRMVLDPLSTMRNLFKCVGLEETSVGKDNHAVRGASAFERFAIRNGCRDRGQGIGDNEGPSSSMSVGAWENTMNRLLHVFAYVAGVWGSDAAWDESYDDGLVFNPQSPWTGSVSCDGGPAQITRDMVINSDGKISHNLWLFCILVALFAARSHLGTSLGDVMERVERGPEGIASLTEFKATLINAQRYVERLRHIHDRDSDDGDMEDSGNHGSTSSPPFPHPALSSLKLDYDTESDDCAQPAAAMPSQPRPAITPRGMSISITAGSGSSNPHYWDSFEPNVVMGRPLETGPQDPEISTSFLPISQASYDLSRGPMIPCRPTQGGAEGSYQETSSNYTTGYSDQRERSRRAEGERPAKRVRLFSDSVVANCVDGLGRAPPESARRLGQHREVQDASDEDNIDMNHDETHRVALMLARIVVCLCRDRYRPPTVGKEQRGVGMTAAELGDLLDVSVFRSLVRNFGSSFLLYVWTHRYLDPDYPSPPGIISIGFLRLRYSGKDLDGHDAAVSGEVYTVPATRIDVTVGEVMYECGTMWTVAKITRLGSTSSQQTKEERLPFLRVREAVGAIPMISCL